MIFAASSFTFIHLGKNIYFVILQFTCTQVHAGENIHLVKSKVFKPNTSKHDQKKSTYKALYMY